MQGTVERAKASLASAWQQASPATDSRLTRTPVAVQRNTHGTHDKAAHITSNAKHAGLSPASLAATALAATAGLHSHIAKLQAARASLSVLTSSPPMVYRTSVLQSTTKRSGPDATVLATPRAYATEQASTRSDVRRPVYTTAFSACMTDPESEDSDESLSVHPSFSAPAGPASAVSMGARSTSRGHAKSSESLNDFAIQDTCANELYCVSTHKLDDSKQRRHLEGQHISSFCRMCGALIQFVACRCEWI